ncbi:MAG TPA: FtsX-like permease family protein [Parafilimonas sp.]|nr:FtsX-like permease family protein [Parafilimonas sp.]
MFRNYLLLALRNMRKNKLHTFINIGGMTVAFACSIFILLLLYYHFSYDQFQANKDSIYKVYSYNIGPAGEEFGTSMSYPLTPALKAENIGIVKATRIKSGGKLVRYKDKMLDMSTRLVDNDFFSMFSFPSVKGAAVNPLDDLSKVVLSENAAGKLFGKEDPIDKTIEVKLDGEWHSLIVSAVVKDPPLSSTMKFSVLARSELDPSYAADKNQWDNQSHPVYVQLANNTTQQQVEARLRSFLKKYRPVDVAVMKRNGYKPDRNGDYRSLHLEPLTQVHFNPAISDSSSVSKPFLYILILISCVIILIASFNFVNLNVGLSFTRTKEIGIRKCLGAGKKEVWLQVWGESFLMISGAMLLAVGLVILLIRSFSATFDNVLKAEMLLDPSVIAILLALIFIVSFIASGYPSAIMAKLKTVEVLKGKITVKKPGMLRNALIVTQFVIAIVLICSTIIIYRQFDHLRTAPLGYNTTSVISIPLKNEERGKDITAKMRLLLASQPSVVAVSGATSNIGLGEDGSTSTSISCFDYGEKTVCGQVLDGDYDFLKTLGIKLLQGRDFSTQYAGDTSLSVIVTESYAAQFGEKNITGFSFYMDSSQPKMHIVGVIPDVRIKSINQKQRPLVIQLSHDKTLDYAWIKVNTNNLMATMEMIKKVYAAVEPGAEFKGSYVNENVDRLYKDERIMANLFSVAAIIAIILSCMGLFGIASIIIRQRVKEIGVRKVLGASVSGIITLVSKEFLKPVIIAFLIAAPLGWWMMNTWLQNYAYRVKVEWWVFVIAGVAALLITMITVSFQSIKAALANPVKSLRTE